jgi:hypothetical protein
MIASCGVNKEEAATKDKSTKQEYLQKGGEIAKITQGELLKNVSRAIGEGGPVYAIDFCNTRALLLKDSLSQLNNCQIRRISMQYRNPEDKPQTKTGKDLLRQYQIAHEKGDSIKPKVYLFEDRIEYYQPILINNGACLICHGIPGEQIAEETLEIIKERYPNDLATGFKMYDFRGAWKITFWK